jgi:hypothetical protein
VTPVLGVGEFIFFTEKKKNIIIDGIFTKILYSTPYFTMTGLYIQFQICSKFSSDDISKNNESVRTPERDTSVGVQGITGEDLSSKGNVSHKTYMQFNPSVDKNKTQIESICEIETHILNVYSKTQLIHHTVRTPVYGLKTQLYSGCIRAFSIDKPITNNNNEEHATSLSFDNKPSPDHPDGVLRRHPDTTAERSNPRTPELPFVKTPTSTSPTFFTKYIKISGVWETDQTYGITYKVFTE